MFHAFTCMYITYTGLLHICFSTLSFCTIHSWSTWETKINRAAPTGTIFLAKFHIRHANSDSFFRWKYELQEVAGLSLIIKICIFYFMTKRITLCTWSLYSSVNIKTIVICVTWMKSMKNHINAWNENGVVCPFIKFYWWLDLSNLNLKSWNMFLFFRKKDCFFFIGSWYITHLSLAQKFTKKSWHVLSLVSNSWRRRLITDW